MGLDDEDDDEYVGSGCDEKEGEDEADVDEGKDELEEENEDDDEDEDEEEDAGRDAEVDLGGVQSLADLSGLQPTGPRNISNNIAWTLRGNH